MHKIRQMIQGYKSDVLFANSFSLSHIFSICFCLGLEIVDSALIRHISDAEDFKYLILLFFLSLSFHSGNIESARSKELM